MDIDTTLKKNELDLEILKSINQKALHRRDIHKLRVNGQKLKTLAREKGTTAQYIFEELYGINRDIYIGQDNKIYLTQKGVNKVGLRYDEVKHPTDANGQTTMFS